MSERHHSERHHFNAAQAEPADTMAPDVTIAGRVISLHEVVKRAHGLAGAAERVADQIAGSHPDKESGAKPSPVPNGLFDELGSVIENLHAALGRIELAVGRAGNKLG